MRTAPHRLLTRLTARRDDEGYALILVLGTMLALSLIVAAGLEYTTHALKSSRHEQDFGTSLGVVQAGAEDFQYHLNNCDDYWQGTVSTCFNAFPTNKALLPTGQAAPTATNWTTAPHVPGTANTSPGTYLYEVLVGPFGGTVNGTKVVGDGSVHLQVWGRSNGVTRSSVVELSKASLLKYVYFTNIEAFSPQAVLNQYQQFSETSCKSGNTTYTNCTWQQVTGAVSQECNHYHYDSGSVQGRANAGDNISITQTGVLNGSTKTVSTPIAATCDIGFGGGDVINGPLHTNDSIAVNGTVTFAQTAETGWQTTNSPAPASATQDYWGSTTPSGNAPVYGGNIPLPATNSAIQAQTATGKTGCQYTGPTQITLNSNGTMTVLSPNTTTTNPGCSTSLPMNTAQTVPLPANGVVYVQNVSGTPVDTSAPWVGNYPQAADNGWSSAGYGPAKGDAYVSGVLNGQLTIAAQNNIAVVNNLTYNDQSATSDDVLGLVANNFVEAYHPVNCTLPAGFSGSAATYALLAGTQTSTCTNLTPPGTTGPLTNLEIDAAIFSLNSFEVGNFNLGAKLGTLKVYGSIIQGFRGAVALSGTTGYVKNYVFDTRLKQLPPPFFLNPLSAPWQVSTFTETQP